MIDLNSTSVRWTITLNRPDKANAINMEMLIRLNEILDEAKQQLKLRSLIITGNGPVFSAGADLNAVKLNNELTTTVHWKTLSDKIAELPCLTIAALNGTLAGGAFGMALACDIRLATTETNFFYPVLKNNLLPQPNDIERLVNLAGLSTAKLILLAGQKLSAKKALDRGLIDLICEQSELTDNINSLSYTAENTDSISLLTIKRLFQNFTSNELKTDAIRAVFSKDADAIKKLKKFSNY